MSLFSKSGKVQYLCPKCRSPDLARFMFAGQQAIACTPCNAWYQWASRIKLSLKRLQSDTGPDTGSEHG